MIEIEERKSNTKLCEFYYQPYRNRFRQDIKIYPIIFPNSKKKRSSYEIKVEQQLKSNGIKFTSEYEFTPERKFRSDFYLHDYGILIECDGNLFHSFPKQKKRDFEKDKIAKALNFKVIRILGNEIRKKNFNILNYI